MTKHGCGTLELMRRIEQPILSSRMEYQIKCHREEAYLKHHSGSAQMHESSNPITGIGEAEARGKGAQSIARNPPRDKKLVGGRLCVTIDGQGSSAQGENCAASDIDDDTMSCKGSPRSTAPSSQRSSSATSKKASTRYSVDSRIEELHNLQQQQIELEKQLILVTKKMSHKYERQKKPQYSSKTGGKTKEMARQWADRALSDNGKYDVYMKSRYTTQAELDYHDKKLDKYHIAKHHRKANIHSKYGDALSKCKITIRGEF